VGFFDKLLGKGKSGESEPKTAGELPRAELAEAVRLLDAGKKADAVALYESLIEAQPDSGELLATISGDLGRHGCLAEIVALITPAYDAKIHGPEAGLNLIQAHLHLKEADSAQMWIDILAALDRPDLAERLWGFEHAAGELRTASALEMPTPIVAPQDAPNINLASISRPLWSYALPGAEAMLPQKDGPLRSIALLPLGAADADGNMLEISHAASIWARAFPFAVGEALAFAPTWQPRAVVAIAPGDKLFVPPRGFGLEQVRGLFRGGKDAADYAVTGFVGVVGDQVTVKVEIIDVRRDKSLKTFSETAALDQAESALSAAFSNLRQYLEATELLPCEVVYAPPAPFVTHLAALDHALAFFLVDKQVVGPDFLGEDPARRADALDALASAAKDPLAPLLAQGVREVLGRLGLS